MLMETLTQARVHLELVDMSRLTEPLDFLYCCNRLTSVYYRSLCGISVILIMFLNLAQSGPLYRVAIQDASVNYLAPFLCSSEVWKSFPFS